MFNIIYELVDLNEFIILYSMVGIILSDAQIFPSLIIESLFKLALNIFDMILVVVDTFFVICLMGESRTILYIQLPSLELPIYLKNPR